MRGCERSVDSLPYDTLGSGSYAAMSVLEHRYKPDMEVVAQLGTQT